MTSFVSYAQNFEDVMLWRALSHVENGFYIDVGAHHPVVDSVSKAFYERGWRGIHIEPTAYYADLLTRDRAEDSVIRAALNDHAGTIVLYEMHGLSTGKADIAQRHREQGIESSEVVVPCLRLDDVIARAGGREIHWLKIDVEGMEQQVLDGWECPILPWVVVVESTLPNSPKENWGVWEPTLLQKGYRFVYFDGLNRFYISPQHLELESAFRSSPNVFDNFALHGDSSAPFCSYINESHKQREHELQQRATSLGDEVSALQRDVLRRTEQQDRLLWERQELERSLAVDLVGVKEEAFAAKQTMFEEFSKRERELLSQLEAGRAEQMRVLQLSSTTESKLSERIVEVKDQGNREKQMLLLKMLELEQTHQNVLGGVNAVATEREVSLTSQLTETREAAHQEKASLLRELLSQEATNSRALELLRREMEEQVVVLSSAHKAQERELLDRIAEARDDAQAQESMHSSAVELLRREMEEQVAVLTSAHVARERELLDRIAEVRDDAHAQEAMHSRALELLRSETEERFAVLTPAHEARERELLDRIAEARDDAHAQEAMHSHALELLRAETEERVTVLISAHEARERELLDRIAEARDDAHAQTLALRGALNEHTERLASAHADRERKLLADIELLRIERTSLTMRWEHSEREAKLRHQEHERTKREQFDNLLVREKSHARVLSELHSAIAQQAKELTGAHVERERELLGRIDALRSERTSLTMRWEHWEREANSHRNAHDETKRAQFANLLTREDSHARALSELNRKKDEQIQQLTHAHNEREGEFRVQLEHAHIRQSALTTHWESEVNGHLNAHEEAKQALILDLLQIEQQLQESRKAKAQLNEELRDLCVVAARMAWMENTFSWKITRPFRALAKIAGIGSMATTESASLPHNAVSEPVVDGTQYAASLMATPNVEVSEDHLDIGVHSPSIASAKCEFEISQPLPPEDFMKITKHIDQVLERKGSHFLDAAYKALLNRSPDSNGMAYYLGRLRSGHSKAAVITQMAGSSEAKVMHTQIPGLDELIASQRRAQRSFWRWFSSGPRIATQLRRIEFELEEIELRSDARLRAFERRVEAIVDRLHSEIVNSRTIPVRIEGTMPVRIEEAGSSVPATEKVQRAHIIDGLTLPVTGSPSELISALEKRVVESLEAASFGR